MAKSDFLDPRWQKFRLKRLEIADWQCEACGCTEETLHVHHPVYISGRKPWEYLFGCTMVLCEECHDTQHELSNSFESWGIWKWEEILGYAIQRGNSHSKFNRKQKQEEVPL